MGYFPVHANRDTERVLSTNLLVICELLLRAGASIDDVNSRTDWQPDTSMEAALQQKAQPSDDEQWLAVKRFVADVRAAGGWSAYVAAPRSQLLALRRELPTLRESGRASPSSVRLYERLFSEVPEEIFIHAFEFWRSERDA